MVFCKPPVSGRVKTRLIGALSAAEAAEVHRACLADTVAMVNAVRGAKTWLFVAAGRATARRLAAQLKLAKKWRVSTQQGADLGERMRNALWGQLRSGATKVVIVGTDSPWMGRERIERALRLLDRADVVLGPSEDGGYYLVGARRVAPQMFSGIAWGMAKVLSETLRALRATRTEFRLLKWDFDLDRPEDLKRMERMARRGRLRAAKLTQWARKWEKSRTEKKRA